MVFWLVELSQEQMDILLYINKNWELLQIVTAPFL